MADIPHQDITFRIIGAAMRGHNEVGPGLREAAYHSALSVAMRDAGLSIEEEKPVADWRARVRRYVWKPKDASKTHPLTRSKSVV